MDIYHEWEPHVNVTHPPTVVLTHSTTAAAPAEIRYTRLKARSQCNRVSVCRICAWSTCSWIVMVQIGREHCAVHRAAATTRLGNRAFPDRQNESVIGEIPVQGQLTGDQEDARPGAGIRIVAIYDVNYRRGTSPQVRGDAAVGIDVCARCGDDRVSELRQPIYRGQVDVAGTQRGIHARDRRSSHIRSARSVLT